MDSHGPNPTGGTASAEELLERTFVCHQDELYGTLYYLVGNAEDARDALQEAFVKCWRHRREVPEIQNLKAWVFRIALNAGRDIRGVAWRRRRRALVDGDPGLIAAPVPSDADPERAEQLALLQRAVVRLRAEEQEVFLLRQNGGLTYEQIAEALGLPAGTVKTRMRMALQKLREALEPEAGPPAQA
jgi:RNA polymerase sigma-70 factor (ECF subfamily)